MAIEVRWELQRKFQRDPWHIYPIFPRPFGLKILMVTDQSDDVPQMISPKLYSTVSWTHYFNRLRPHPVLCGPNGMITKMPDLGFRNLTNYIARSLLETGGFRPRLHPRL